MKCHAFSEKILSTACKQDKFLCGCHCDRLGAVQCLRAAAGKVREAEALGAMFGAAEAALAGAGAAGKLRGTQERAAVNAAIGALAAGSPGRSAGKVELAARAAALLCRLYRCADVADMVQGKISFEIHFQKKTLKLKFFTSIAADPCTDQAQLFLVGQAAGVVLLGCLWPGQGGGSSMH